MEDNRTIETLELNSMDEPAEQPTHAERKNWAVCFSPEDRGQLLTAGTGLSVFTAYNTVHVQAHFSGRPEPCILQAEYRQGAAYVLAFTGARIALYADDKLEDEDWPLGDPAFDVGGLDGIPHAICPPALACPPDDTDGQVIDDLAAFLPSGRNCRAGDCMPFADGGRYHLFYLFDRRGHRSKYGLGAHQWDHISTDDLVHWRRHPRAVSIDKQYEASICTGSTIRCGEKYYCFYAVRMSDGSPAQLTWAVSEDGDRFVKSGQTLTLSEAYDGPSARDPKVFLGEDGQYHMLVTTTRKKTGHGALAHLTSSDLESWTEEAEPFLELTHDNQPECSDYFAMGGRYYLLVSNYGAGRLLRSDKPFGPWEEFENSGILPGSFRVPKVAFLGDRLIAAAFDTEGVPTYAGRIVLAEGIQQPDGSFVWKKL